MKSFLMVCRYVVLCLGAGCGIALVGILISAISGKWYAVETWWIYGSMALISIGGLIGSLRNDTMLRVALIMPDSIRHKAFLREQEERDKSLGLGITLVLIGVPNVAVPGIILLNYL